MRREKFLEGKVAEIAGDIDWMREDGKATAMATMHRLHSDLHLELDGLIKLREETEQEITTAEDGMAQLAAAVGSMPLDYVERLAAACSARLHPPLRLVDGD